MRRICPRDQCDTTKLRFAEPALVTLRCGVQVIGTCDGIERFAEACRHAKALNGLALVFAKQFPECARVNGPHGKLIGDVEEVTITGDKHVGVR